MSTFEGEIKKQNSIKKILPFVKINAIAQINECIDRQNLFNEDDRNYLFCAMLAKLNTEEGHEAIKSLIRGKSQKYQNIDIELHAKYGSLSVADLVRCLPANYQETAARSLMRKLNPHKLFPSILKIVMEEPIAEFSNEYKQYLELAIFLPKSDKDQIINKAISLASTRRKDLNALGYIFPMANENQKKEIIDKAIRWAKNDFKFNSFVSEISPFITSIEDLETLRLSFIIGDDTEKDEAIASLLDKVVENDNEWDHLNSLSDILDNISENDVKISTISHLIPKAPLKYLPLLTNKIVAIQMDVLDSIIENFSSTGGDKSRLLCSVALRYTQLGDIDKSIEVLKSVDAVRGKGVSASGFDSIKLTYKFPDVVIFEFIKTLIKSGRNEIAVNLLLQRLPDSRAVKIFLGDRTELLLNGNEVMFAVMDYYAKKNIYDPETNSWLVDRLNELNLYRTDSVDEILNSMYIPDIVIKHEEKLSRSHNNLLSLQTQKTDEITKEFWRSKLNQWVRFRRSALLTEFKAPNDSLAILTDPAVASGMIQAIIDVRRWWS